MDDRYIVSIDFGTFKTALAVACVSGNDTRLIYYKETPAAGMRCSRILNEAKVAQQLKTAIADAEDILGIKITGAVVGMPRFYVRTEENSARNDTRDPDSYISEAEIEELKSFAQDSYPLEDPEREAVYGAVAQSFSTSEEFQLIEDDVIGMSGKVLEGNFKIFIGNKSSLERIDRVMRSVGIVSLKKYFVPQLTANAVLFPSEMDNGVAMIDFGGGCTSLSIYYKNVLRYYSSIPFGGVNVTKDIQMESNIRTSLAENIKLAYGACIPEKLMTLSEKQLLLQSENGEQDKRLTVKYLSEIITAREEEIISAMLYEIGLSKFADKLQSGIVITGGGAQMTNLSNLITEISGYNVRVGKPNFKGIYNCCTGDNTPSATTAIGLVKAAVPEQSLNCAFRKDSQEAAETVETSNQPTESEHESGMLPGMLTDEEIAEKKKREEERRRKEEERRKREEEKKKKKPSIFAKWTKTIENKLGSTCDNILNMMDDDESNEQ